MKRIISILMVSATICSSCFSQVGKFKTFQLGTKSVTGISIDSTSASKSAVKLITEKAAKAYADLFAGGTATNSTKWNGYSLYTNAVTPASNINYVTVLDNANSRMGISTAAAMQTFLGLGPNAYTSTPFMPLAGNSIKEGTLSINNYQLSNDFGAGYLTVLGAGYNSGSINKGINFGYNSTLDFGYIGSVHNSTIWKPLVLQPVGGGGVFIGGTATSDQVVKNSGSWDINAATVTGINGKISAGTNVTITGSGSTASPYVINLSSGGGGGAGWESVVNIQDYGAIPNDGLDDYAAIQAAVNYAVLTPKRKVVVPAGDYLSSNTIQIISGGSVNPTAGYVSLDIEGESNFWNTGGTSRSSITLTVKDRPLIAIQRGEGCHITKLTLIGAFRAPNANTNRFAYFAKTESNYVTDGSRDNPFSPNAGIAIDPYWPTADSTWKGTGNWYPSLGKYYGLGFGTGGTGNVVENCQIDGFVIGVASSTNVEMLNAELTIIRKVSFGNGSYYGLKWCVVGTQAQEKVNIIKECSAWSETFGFFSSYAGYNGVYGYGRSGEGSTETGNWNIEDINIANAMVKFISSKSSGWFPVYVNRIYGEGVGSIGRFSGTGCTFTNSMIDFEDPEQSGYNSLLYCENPGTVFTGNTFRYYGRTGRVMPMELNRGLFIACTFSGMPYTYANGTGYTDRYENCFVGDSPIPFGEKTETQIYKASVGTGIVHSYGNVTYMSLDYNGNDIKEKIQLSETRTAATFYVDAQQFSVTVTNHSTSFASSTPSQYTIGQIVDIRVNEGFVNVGFGHVTAIGGANGNTITVGYMSNNIVTGTYFFLPVYPVNFSGTFIGDFFNNSGVQEIRNVQMDWGTANGMVGQWIQYPKWSPSNSMPFKITSYDATNNKFIVATGGNQGLMANATGVYFSNNTKKTIEGKVEGAPSLNTNRFLLPKNSFYITNKNSDNERIWKGVTSGFNTGTGTIGTWIEQ